MKFEVGKKLEPFCCDTICQDGVSAEDLTEGLPTMFLFLRYYGWLLPHLPAGPARSGSGI